MQLVNSTVSDNSTAGNGKGVYTDYEIAITHATIAGNTASGAVAQILNDNSVEPTNTIIAGSATNCGGGEEDGPNITSLGNNIDRGTPRA